MNVRVATSQSVDTLLDMMADLNAIEGIPFSRPKFGRVLKQLLADPSLGLVPLFLVKREIVGYAVVTYNFDLEWGGRDAFITEFYIKPEHRGLGFGALAMALLEKLARRNKVKALHLGVRRENLAAARLYEKAGFTYWTRRVMMKVL
jgi:ribosomal protein S18 acetylase RimI-like enzyme